MDEMSDSVQIVGPFETHAVVVNGRKVPYLTATPVVGGRVCINLDDRFSLELSLQEMEQIVPFVAHCIAVASGFSGFPDSPGASPLPRQVMPRMRSLELLD
jgi:hypothetical protein